MARLIQMDQDVEQNASGNISVFDGYGFQRRVADSTITATNEQHADVGDAGEHFGIVTGAARQIKRFDAGPGDCLRQR